MQQTVAYFEYLIVGAKATALVGGVAYLLAILFGFAAGIARAENIPVAKTVAFIYVEIFRGTSLIVQLFWIYYSLPLIGLSISPLMAGCLGIGLNSGAFASEIVRGALLSVPAAQLEAAAALDLSRGQTLWKIVIPQAVREMAPPFGNLSIAILKDTALVSMISIADIAFRAQQLRTFTYDSARIYGVTLLIYFAMALVLLMIGRTAEFYARPKYLRNWMLSRRAAH
jgi:polar amino acid transport system permease protein